ncbi:MAG TPA: hypothetical protein VK324_14265 [Tepidisphaeraceae bacterium]|nr:hypothetical protein [Tepidisphaeraceae bacterium]
MSDVADNFEHHVDFDPAGDVEALLKAVPAKWAVYLFADEAGRPVQLLSVKNLRYSLKRRLGVEEAAAPDAAVPLSRRVNYRELVRHVYWTRVDSAFEADLVYLEAARACFPQTYQGMVGFRPAWFVHVNPDAAFPRYAKTTDLSLRTGRLIGPIDGKEQAQKLVQLVEDAFDLCRYYPVLVEAPRGRACAYKEMGKCPAPCDGTVSMDAYRQMVQLSVDTLVNPAPAVAAQTARMQQAAMDLAFESAGRVKQHVDQLSQLGKGAFRFAADVRDFQFLSLQRGPAAGEAKAFVVTPGRVQLVACVIDVPERPGDLLRTVLATAAAHADAAVDLAGAERVGVVAHHLFSPKAVQGVFLRIADVNERSFQKAYRDLLKQKATPADEEGEGVMKELQAM